LQPLIIPPYGCKTSKMCQVCAENGIQKRQLIGAKSAPPRQMLIRGTDIEIWDIKEKQISSTIEGAKTFGIFGSPKAIQVTHQEVWIRGSYTAKFVTWILDKTSHALKPLSLLTQLTFCLIQKKQRQLLICLYHDLHSHWPRDFSCLKRRFTCTIWNVPWY